MARGAQYYETSTPQLDWVKKFTRSCSRLTGKLDTTTCSQQLFQVPKAQRCSSGTGPSKRLQPTPAAPIVTLPVPDLVCVPVPLSWAGTTAQRCPGTVRSSTMGRGRRASLEPPARNVLLGRAGVRGARSSCPGERDRPPAGGDAKQCCLYLAKRSAKPSQEDSTAQPPLQRN